MKSIDGWENNDTERVAAYRAILAQGVDNSDIETIRQHVNRDCALGSATFQTAMARACGRRAHIQNAGRPRSSDATSTGMFDDLW
jgi:putative transposase